MILEYDDRIYGINKGDTAFCNQRKPYSIRFLDDSEYIFAIRKEKKRGAKKQAKKTVEGNGSVGEIIRADRQARGLSVAELAKRIGIGAATLHRIETGSSSPSLDLLLRVAKKVDRPIVSFFRKADSGFDFRENDEIELIETKNFSFKVIAPYGLIHPKVVIWHVRAKAGADYDAQQEQGYDWAYMLQGKLTVDYGSKIYALNDGDVFFCDGRKPHIVHTVDDSEYIYACKKT
jgi:transcriptional regulator with XRE-family HTH domain